MNPLKIINKKGTSTDAVFLTIVRILSALCALLRIKIVSINFSLEEYGTYSQAVLIISTVSVITILGMTDGVNYYYNKVILSERDRITAVSTLFTSQLIIGIISATVILLCGHLLTDYFHNPALNAIYIWIAFQPLLTNFLPMLQCLYISVGKTKIIVVRNLVLSIFRLTLFIYACYVTKSIITILAFCFIFDLLQTAYFWFTIKKYGVNITFKNFDYRILGDLLKYCIPVALYIVLNSLTRDIDKWIVGYMGDTEELAIYANCSRVLPFDMLTGSFAMVLTPIITRYILINNKEVRDIFSNYLNFSLITTAILVLPAIILSKDLLITLYAVDYLPGIGVFVAYLLVDLLRFANITIIFSSSGRPRPLIYISLLTIILNTLLAIILYKIIGLTGPAIGTLLSISVACILMFIGGSKIIETNIFTLINWRKFFIIIIEASILGIIFIAITPYINLNPIYRFFLFYIPSICCLCLLNKDRIISQLKLLNRFK